LHKYNVMAEKETKKKGCGKKKGKEKEATKK
jgi:hypothetical protein